MDAFPFGKELKGYHICEAGSQSEWTVLQMDTFGWLDRRKFVWNIWNSFEGICDFRVELLS